MQNRITGWVFLLVLIVSPVILAAPPVLQVGTQVPDFTLPVVSNQLGQRLSEQRGKPLMLIFPGRCNACTDDLLPLQRLHASHSLDGLVSWVIWTPYRNWQPPVVYLPVLEASGDRLPAVLAAITEPEVLLINPDGTLAHRIQSRRSRLAATVTPVMNTWLETLVPALILPGGRL